MFVCVRDALEGRFLLYDPTTTTTSSSSTVERALGGGALDRLMNNGAVSSSSSSSFSLGCHRIVSSIPFLLLVVVVVQLRDYSQCNAPNGLGR